MKTGIHAAVGLVTVAVVVAAWFNLSNQGVSGTSPIVSLDDSRIPYRPTLDVEAYVISVHMPERFSMPRSTTVLESTYGYEIAYPIKWNTELFPPYGDSQYNATRESSQPERYSFYPDEASRSYDPVIQVEVFRYSLENLIAKERISGMSLVKLNGKSGYWYEANDKLYFLFPADEFLYRVTYTPYRSRIVTAEEALWLISTFKPSLPIEREHEVRSMLVSKDTPESTMENNVRIAVGDTFGDFTVSKIRLGFHNINTVEFSGEITLKGTLMYETAFGAGLILNVKGNEFSKLPRVYRWENSRPEDINVATIGINWPSVISKDDFVFSDGKLYSEPIPAEVLITNIRMSVPPLDPVFGSAELKEVKKLPQ